MHIKKCSKGKKPCKAHFTIMYLLYINGCEQALQSLEQFSSKLGADTAVEKIQLIQQNILLTLEARDELEASK